MGRDTPNPVVDASLPDDLTFREFNHIIFGLSHANMQALHHGALEDADVISSLQIDLLKENPEVAKKLFEQESVAIADIAGDTSVEEFIEDIGLDPDELDYETQDVGEDGFGLDPDESVDIDVE